VRDDSRAVRLTGVLAAIVAGALAGAGVGGLRLSLERPRQVDERERVAVNLTARTSAVSGPITMEVPLGWFPAGAATLETEPAALLETTLAVELARTDLLGGAYLAAEVGDAVVFEGVSAPPDDAPWTCTMSIGGKRAPAEMLPSGDVRPAGKFVHVADPPAQDRQDMSEKDRSGDGGGLSADGAAVLASAPVEVVAEIGRMSMRGDEVLGLLAARRLRQA
jgi:hypothetical protein